MSTFFKAFAERRTKLNSVLCAGIDPVAERLPAGYTNDAAGWLEFINELILATADSAVAYKPNLAFFECMENGLDILEETTQIIRQKAPGALIIADAKRGDIGNTAAAYARAFFEKSDFDAITVNPYMGMETLEPFYNYKDKATIVLCLTSNPGAAQFQTAGNPPLFERVAAEVGKTNEETGNLWMVVGATRSTEHVEKIRAIAPRVPLLVPGVGAQGGDLEAILKAAGPDVLINASRSIMYAASTKDQVPGAVKKAAQELQKSMEALL